MNAVVNTPVDPLTEWLLHVRPVGLVLGPNIIREEELAPPRQGAVETEAVRALLSADADEDVPVLPDPWAFFSGGLGWEARFVAGAPGGPALPDNLAVKVAEHEVTLAPDWAVRELGDAGGYQLLVKLHLDQEADQRGALEGWEASPHQQFERLLRESGVPVGVLVDRAHLRIVYAPPGETSGWIAFPLRSLGTVAGRPMLGGLKLMLRGSRLFTEPEHLRLPKLLARSREAQNQVSTRLAEQVLGALHELLRAIHAADPARIERLAAERPQHLYEGLLTTLLRLVFLLYAEDRDLIPSVRTGESIEIYEEGYSVRGLYARLAEDRALNPDTMDERVGGWGRLLALFRLVHAGHPSGWITPRGGKLFDPAAFPFLEGRDAGEPPGAARVLPIRDGALLRILEGLMTIEARTLTGERVRERLSYRALDVEQIGSVYETVMGFKAEISQGHSLALKVKPNAKSKTYVPVFVNLDLLLGTGAAQRIKLLKDEYGYDEKNAKRDAALKKATSVSELATALDAVVDERGSPKKRVGAPGTPILQPTDERRRTGSHYTPRTLTEPIVRHALEPVFERLRPDATPEQILDLKVCDPAMGSGAFLVEACRALATRLVAAWARYPDKKSTIPRDEDEDLHARRLVAQRCLYGVDKNPLATDLAKLSLWLATLARDHEFTFLDHALKTGDSLVGLTQAQIAAAHWDTERRGLPLFRQLVQQRVAEAMKGRAEIQAAPDDTRRAVQEARHRKLEDRIKEVRLIGDAVIAAFFSIDKPKAREAKRAAVENSLSGSPVAWDKLTATAATLKEGAHPLAPFHWETEFPEVFARENGGFDALIGNPPFLGGTNISQRFGMQYFRYLSDSFAPAGHHCDLVAYFFRRAFALIRDEGCFGLIATNTISQGDTREGGLAEILKNGGRIIRAIRRFPWPGDAAVVVKVIHLARASKAKVFLDNKSVSRISAFVVAGDIDSSPNRLAANRYYSLGSKIYGQGFVFDDHDLRANPLSTFQEIVDHHPEEAKRIFAYVVGDDLNKEPRHASARYVIQLSDLQEERELQLFPALYKIVKEKVYPERMKLGGNPNNIPLRRKWWAYQAHRPELYAQLRRLRRAICLSRVSPHLALCLTRSDVIFSEMVVVIADDRMQSFASMQSRGHEVWVRFLASTLEDRLRYTPSDCFETFSFPAKLERLPELEAMGQAYHDHRAALMVRRNEGMTKTYNRFHDRNEAAHDIQHLRDLHAEMDHAVLEAYGWHDLAARAEPIFLDEENEDDYTYQGRLFWPSDFRDEVLARLLALNAERHAEEVRLGIAPGMKGKRPEDDEMEEDE